MATQRILIVGCGAVGQVIGGLLHRAGHQVTFLARQYQVQALQEDGIRLRGRGTNVEATGLQASSDLFMFDTFDYVFVCVRGHQREEVFALLERQTNLSQRFVWCCPAWWFESGDFTRFPGLHVLFMPGFAALPRTDHLQVKLRRSYLEPFSEGSPDESSMLAELLSDSGLPTREKDGLAEQVSLVLTILFPLLVGLETVGFSVQALCRDKERLRAVVQAQRQALWLARKGGLAIGFAGSLWTRLPVSFLAGFLGLALRLVRGFNRDVLEVHFKKTRNQQAAMLQRLLDAPFADEKAASHLAQLLELAEATREP